MQKGPRPRAPNPRVVSTYDWLIVGGGIVGLATALSLQERFPGARVAVLEKEGHLAAHQTGHNSGVLHSGLYYKPGSFKARLCVQGNAAMLDFCRANDIPHRICGKLVVATEAEELPRLEELARRGEANGVSVRRLTEQEAQQYEPEVRCVAALHVASTGIVDFARVTQRMGELLRERGGEVHLNTRAQAVQGGFVATNRGEFRTCRLVNCGGLHSDRVARAAGADPKARIVPFRGEYYHLERTELVRGLIYPVPNPAFPFLGVHFTRMLDGSVHVGPNAVLALKREGYRWTDFSLRDTAETLLFPGFWRLAARYAGEGLREIARSLSKRRFADSARRLIPEVRQDDLKPGGSGVRAQAVLDDGSLVDDFLVVHQDRAMHVCNAPSPAATASLAIGRMLAEEAASRA